LNLSRDALHFVHYPRQIATPEFFDLFFSVTAAYQLMNHVEGFAGLVPAFDSAAAV